MKTIRLPRGEWAYDEGDRLGPAGGFGEVFRGQGPGGSVAVKQLKLSAAAAAHREMDIGGSLADRSLAHVVPVLDCGQDAESDLYFLVMPICDFSLQEHIAQNGTLPPDEAQAVLLDIFQGLEEVGDIVHRDLKPGNILRHEGRWKIADFGIAKFVEDSTSLQTLRDSLTPAYGAPEQWMGERPSKATDVYAVACIACAMLRGSPPFVGSAEDMRDGHLRQTPPAISEAGNLVQSLLTQMLRKSPSARPSLARCVSIMSRPLEAAERPRHPALVAAVSSVATKAAEEEAARQQDEARTREWAALAAEGEEELRGIIARLFEEVCEVADGVHKKDLKFLEFGEGTLMVAQIERAPRNQKGGPNNPQSGWNVAAWTKMSVRSSRSGYTWGATLCYSSTGSDAEFRWREISFYAWGRASSNDEPYAILPTSPEFDVTLSRTMNGIEAAVGPATIDCEDEEHFRARWITLLSRAADGRLSRPSHMPVQPSFFEGH